MLRKEFIDETSGSRNRIGFKRNAIIDQHSNSNKTWKQSKLLFRQPQNTSNSEDLFSTSLSENILLESNCLKSNRSTKNEYRTTSSSSTTAIVSNERKNTQRDMLIISGRVDFCIKIRKLYPDISTLWNVYGKVIRITEGKQRSEFLIIIRSDCGGPVLQTTHYDFHNKLESFEEGSYVRVVGRFLAENRFQSYKLENLMPENFPTDECFTRIHNVITFALVQQSANTNSKTMRINENHNQFIITKI